MSQAPADPFFPAEKYKQAARPVIGDDGKRRIEKRPIQKSARAVHPDGHITWLVLYAGPAQTAENDPYKMAITYSKQRAGFLFLNRCPQMEGYETQRHLPDSVRGRKPCSEGSNGGPISDASPCSCVIDTIKARSTVQKAATDKINANAGDAAAKRAEALALESLAETKKQNALLIDLATAPKNKGRASE